MADSADYASYMDNDAIKAAQDAKRRRREAIVEAIRRAGINPAEIEVTVVSTDEEQARMLQQMSDRNEAKQMAERFGRDGLRARLRQTIESASARNGVSKAPLNGNGCVHQQPSKETMSPKLVDQPED